MSGETKTFATPPRPFKTEPGECVFHELILVCLVPALAKPEPCMHMLQLDGSILWREGEGVHEAQNNPPLRPRVGPMQFCEPMHFITPSSHLR